MSAIFNTIEECPSWSRELVQRMKANGVVQGDEKGKLQLDTGDIKALAWLERYVGKKDPIYKTLDDVPEWGKEIVEKLVTEKVIVGDGKGNINLKEDTLKTLVFLQRCNLLK